MTEYLSEALVIDKEPIGESDFKIFLYTKELGKIIAKVKSGRKITSKLNSHLEPLNNVIIRLISAGSICSSHSFQIVDVLRMSRWSINRLPILDFIKKITVDIQSDNDFWEILMGTDSIGISNNYIIKKLMAVSGFDPFLATCVICNRANPNNFIISSANFWCSYCLDRSQMSRDEVVSI